ncbi:MAG: hypothetical protein LAP39_11395 [Acidobacteriia bacterium]|nr:hypothetical protein [Terriglobia bacterium]
MAKRQAVEVEGRKIALSNLEKALYPAGFTKGQVIDYYTRASPFLLPHLKDRPVTLIRFPDGVGSKHFYEKDAPKFTPDRVRTFPVPRRAGGPRIRYILINDLATYSLRAKRDRPYASLPVNWEELRSALTHGNVQPLYFEPEAALKRIEETGDLFAEVLNRKQNLPNHPRQ